MEDTPQVQVGKWEKLPSIPIEFEISIGQRTVLHRGKIYAIFGLNHEIIINCYDTVSKEWFQLFNEEDDQVQKSQYHGLVVHNNRIYLIAGTQLIAGNFYVDNRVCYFDLNTHKWHKIEAKGTAPPPMYLHSCVVYEDCLYTFGGKLTHEGNDCTNKMYKFDLATETWSEVEAKGDIPAARRAQGAAVYEDALYIFGGWNGVETFGDFYTFDFETSTWSRIVVENGPQPRQLDYMVEYGGKLYIYGGEGGKKYLNDFWSYDIEKNEWKEITDDEKIPDFGRYANALVMDDNVLYMLGGSGTQVLDDLYSITLPVVKKERKLQTLFEKLQSDMRTLRLGQSAAFDFAILSKKKDLTVHGHKIVYTARVPGLMKLFHEQGHYSVDLSKKLTNGLSEWIYEDRIADIEKYTFDQLEALLIFAVANEINGLVDLVESEFLQRLDPAVILELDYSVMTSRVKQMCWWIWDKQTDQGYAENSTNISAIMKAMDSPSERPNMEYSHTLSRDLLAMRKLTQFSDVIVQANDTLLDLHKLMLNLRFPYFKGLISFECSLKLSPSSADVMHALHIPFSAFNSIIDYVYSSELLFEPQDYFAIASAASFYMIDDLHFYADLTEKFLPMITKENSQQLYDLALEYDDAFSDTIEYIQKTFWKNNK